MRDLDGSILAAGALGTSTPSIARPTVHFRGNESSAMVDKAEVALLSALLTFLAITVAAFVAEAMASLGADINGVTKPAREVKLCHRTGQSYS